MQYQGVEVGSDNAQNSVRASELSKEINKKIHAQVIKVNAIYFL